MTIRSCSSVALAAIVMAVTPAANALAASSSARPATRSERSAIMAAFTANDGSSSEVHGVYVARSSSSLAVVCVRTPEAGSQAYVFSHSRRSWRYATSGPVGRAGNTTDRRLEQACG